ncbi:alanine racemase [Candidatus Gracilibacteria bacterium]|nr:alanine racemase [Candidatus Gracilibacteria bacterium]
MLNQEVFKNIRSSGKKILVVTKYWDTNTTLDIIGNCKKQYDDIWLGLGENRIETIREKLLPREKTHFIGNIQSRKIPEIVKYCSYIHSLGSLDHAKKIEKQGIPIQAFIQVRLDDTKSIGIEESELGDFLKICRSFHYLTIIGISGMGSIEAGEQEKRNEFGKLIFLRNTYISDGYVSAGTSQDYKIALEEGVDIVRIGNKAIY